MLRHYLKVALRTLRRNPGYTAIHVLGLSVGIGCCILIALYVQEELSYDDFHEYGDRIVYVGKAYTRYGDEPRCCGGAGYGVAHHLKTQVPEVVRAARMIFNNSGNVVHGDRRSFEEDNITYVDSSFFELFSFPLLRGDPTTVLDEPNSVVITERKAQEYFGDEDPVGQPLTLDGYSDETVEATVTGVTRVPEKSSITFDFLISLGTISENYRIVWGSPGIYENYALLQPGATIDQLRSRLASVEEEHFREESTFHLLPLSELYLSDRITRAGFRASPEYLYIFGAVALFLLLVACFNYVNLATARATTRAGEVAIRKTNGARRSDLVGQFVGEAVLLAWVSYLVGLGLARAALPVFNPVFGTDLGLSMAGHVPLLAGLLGLALLAGVLAGSYPALLIARYEPTGVLRDRDPRTSRRSFVRSGLIVGQFALSTALIVATIVVYQQMEFVQEKDLGFRTEQMVVMEAGGSQMAESYEAVEQQLERHSGIRQVTASSGVPGDFWHRYGFDPEPGPPDRNMTFYQISAGYNFAETLDLEMVAGRFFSRAHPTDTTNAVVLNEASIDALEWKSPRAAIGKQIQYGDSSRTVVGVVENFHYSSLKEEVRSVLIDMKRPGFPMRYHVFTARIDGSETERVLDHMRSVYADFPNERPFNYYFLDEKFGEMYRTEQRLATVFTTFAALAVLIACLGLFGLAAFVAERRTKEIGIRKVLGATVERILAQLSWDFIKLVAVGILVAVPTGYVLMSNWLDRFAYRIDLGAGAFLTAAVLAVLVALGTVSYHALRAAWTNPAESLRYE